MPRPTINKRLEQKALTRERLLRAARRVFATRGYQATGIGAICRAARMTHGALYHHFAGKTELFVAVLEEVSTEVATQVQQATTDKVGWQQVIAACDAYLDACLDPAVQTIYLRDAPAVLASEDFRSIDRAVNEPMVVGLIAGWMGAGLLRDMPALLTARVIGGAFAEAGMAIAESSEPSATRRELGAIMHVVLEGLRA